MLLHSWRCSRVLLMLLLLLQWSPPRGGVGGVRSQPWGATCQMVGLRAAYAQQGKERRLVHLAGWLAADKQATPSSTWPRLGALGRGRGLGGVGVIVKPASAAACKPGESCEGSVRHTPHAQQPCMGN